MMRQQTHLFLRVEIPHLTAAATLFESGRRAKWAVAKAASILSWACERKPSPAQSWADKKVISQMICYLLR